MPPKTRPTFTSLFAGVGGFDLGLEAAGFDCVAQVEWDAQCQSVLRHRWPNVPKWGDIHDVRGSDLPASDVIAFGSPCQDLSLAGTRRGFDGDKSSTFFEAIRIIGEMLNGSNGAVPRAAIWENVRSAIRTNHGRDFGAALNALAGIGALVIEWCVVDAAWWLPQKRSRIFVVAIFDPRAAARCPEQLFPVEPGRYWHHPSDERTMGFYYTHGKQDVPAVNAIPTLKVATGVGIPSPCCIVGETRRPRKLTPRECERAMGWPDDHTRWADDGTELPVAARYKMCGNGVASPTAQWVGEQLLPLLTDD